jgi:predicted amidohydrolase
MSGATLIVGAAQSASVPGDVAANAAHHLEFGRRAADEGVQLLIFPELSLTGYELALARANQVRADSPMLDPLRSLAASRGITLVVGAPVPGETGILYIAALALRPDGSVVKYTKEYVHSSEEHVFTSGPGGPPLRIGNSTIALSICRDAKQPEHVAKAAALGAGLYAAGVMVDEPGYAVKAPLLAGFARQHQMAILMANYSGSTGGDISMGRSAVWNENGEIVVESAGNAEEIVIAEKANGAWRGRILPIAG